MNLIPRLKNTIAIHICQDRTPPTPAFGGAVKTAVTAPPNGKLSTAHVVASAIVTTVDAPAEPSVGGMAVGDGQV